MSKKTKTTTSIDPHMLHLPLIHHVLRVKEVRADRSACNPVESLSLCRIKALDVVHVLNRLGSCLPEMA